MRTVKQTNVRLPHRISHITQHSRTRRRFFPYFQHSPAVTQLTNCPRTLPMPSFVRPPHTAAHVADSFPAARRTPRYKSDRAFLSVRFHRRACSTKEIRIRLCELLAPHFAYHAAQPAHANSAADKCPTAPPRLHISRQSSAYAADSFPAHSQHSPAVTRPNIRLPVCARLATHFAYPPQCSRTCRRFFPYFQHSPTVTRLIPRLPAH